MSLPRLNHAPHIADQLNVLAAMVKTRSRASLTDANRILETIATRFFNALFRWDLVNLNIHQANYPAADLGDRGRRIAIQVTNEDGSDKIKHTTSKAVEHGLGTDFDRLIVFFLLPKKPAFPKQFTQPPHGPKVETWDIADLLKQLQDLPDLEALARAAKVLDEEMGKILEPGSEPKFDLSHFDVHKYAPAELIGREPETTLLSDAWEKAVRGEPKRPHILTFVALGGEGKTALVAKWTAGLAHHDWPGCDAAFAWSFYSQGTREQHAASSDTFLKEALTFFGDPAMAGSAQHAFDKGRRLAQLVGERRALLILDGLEPLQYAPTSPTPGELKDQGLGALLKGLAAASHGLCVVTTRYSIPDLRAYWQTTAPEVKLLRLSREAGVRLLQELGVKGSLRKDIPGAEGRELLNEFEKLVEDVKGHALTLNLLGTFLRDAHAGDIRKRDLVKLEAANPEVQEGHAFHVLDAYVRWLEGGAEKGRSALAFLRLMGLFDRPATADCLAALLKAPAISDLTDPLVGLTEAQRNIALRRLEEAKLLTVNRDAPGTLLSMDAHPLIREYFAQRLRQQPDAWRAAHRRLYEHLCDAAPECTKVDAPEWKGGFFWLGGPRGQPTLEDLQPLYQAVAHGCQAGLEQEVCDNVYNARIVRGDEYYSARRLCALGSDLGAEACFFDQPWSRVSPALRESDQSWILNGAAIHLSALGRLTEAIEPMRAGLKNYDRQKNWKAAATVASNLSSLELTLGEIARALGDAQQAVDYADHSGDEFQRWARRARLADAMHQGGRPGEAESHFREAEEMMAKDDDYSYSTFLFSDVGFKYCDLLLADAERTAWKTCQGSGFGVQDEAEKRTLIKTCRCVERRAAQTLNLATMQNWVREIALDHLTLGRAALYWAVLEESEIQNAKSEIEQAVSGLRRAGQQDDLPRGLLTRAWLRFRAADPDGARADLDEVWEIAERGPMRLFMADVHLYRARLFGSLKCEVRSVKYPWGSPQADLAAARKLIEQCGYWRRKEELEDAEEAAKSW